MGYGRKMEISVGFKELGILAKKYVQNSKTVIGDSRALWFNAVI